MKFTCKRDDLTIRGHIWGKQEGRQKAVILSHGFLANERSCFTYAKLLASMGYLAVTYDFCGGGIICRSDGRKQDMTVLTEKKDLLAVIKAVREQFDVTDVYLLGCSQGGFVSGMTAAELGAEDIAGLILFYPAICIPDDARAGKMMFYKFDPANIPDLLGRFPMKLGGDYARCVINMDPYEELKGYEGPVFLIHGTADPIVNISYSQKLKDIYPHYTFVEIGGGAHGFKRKHDQKACEALTEFMKTEEEGKNA